MTMNGPSSMYKLKPVFQLPEKLDLPTCMYPMKSVLAGNQPISNAMEKKEVKKEILQEITDKKPLPEVAALEARWTSVLEQLSDLKKQMTEIRKTINSVDVKPVLTNATQLGASSLSNLKELNGAVINASPASPPYSLLLIKQLYKNSIQFSFSCHVHSTVKNLPEISKSFNDPESVNNALKLILIWKEDLLDTELVIHPVKQLAIKGEVNILRYLGRLGLSPLGYPSDDVVSTVQIDNVLDTCHRLLHVRTAKEKTSIYRNLNAKLGKGSYFGGENVNIIDIAAWSAFKQSCTNPGSDLTQNLVKWFQRIEQLLD